MLKRILIALGLAAAPGLALPASLDECESRELISDLEKRGDAHTRSDERKRHVVAVRASWDEDASLWAVTSPLGLSAKAETFPLLVRQLKRLSANGPWPNGVSQVTYVVNNQVEITVIREPYMEKRTTSRRGMA